MMNMLWALNYKKYLDPPLQCGPLLPQVPILLFKQVLALALLKCCSRRGFRFGRLFCYSGDGRLSHLMGRVFGAADCSGSSCATTLTF